MPGPTLTPQEIAQLKKEQARASSAASTFTAQISAQQARAVELAVADGAFKKFFDYYNTDIIGKYDDEQRWINGRTITDPIVEADIVSCASLLSGRIQPSLPATDVIRIAQFDGTPTTTNTDNELQHITDQAPIENDVKNGYPASAISSSVVTSTVITPSSTTLSLTDPGSSFSITLNSIYVVLNGLGDLAVIKVLSFTDTSGGTPPPYTANLTIQVLIPPSGSITTGRPLTVFNGFNNTERTNKTPTNPNFQPLMNYFVSQLQSKINQRITTLNNQLTAISANQDPEPGVELSTATTNVNASKTFLTNYLVGTDISDTGLTSLSIERSSRSSQASSRVTQINNAYTGRTKNYYNERYNVANNRANTARGSLRIQKDAEQNSTTAQGYATTLAAQASAIGDVLP